IADDGTNDQVLINFYPKNKLNQGSPSWQIKQGKGLTIGQGAAGSPIGISIAETTGVVTVPGLKVGGTVDFGIRTAQLLDMYGPGYGIGVQSYTHYFRSDKNFAWFKGGGHSHTTFDPGTNGTVAMVLSDGKLGLGLGTQGEPAEMLHVQGNARITGTIN